MAYIKYLRFYFWVIGSILFTNILSVGLFIYEPRFFYFRSWEYFSEIAYRYKEYPASWNLFERSDLTRNHYFFYQDPHKTFVSVDVDGFRSNKFDSKSYDILFAGDSAIFGSGLSDNETLPWMVSEIISNSVFNGGRTSLWNILERDELSNVKVVVDCITERDVRESMLPSYSAHSYMPLSPNDRDVFSLLSKIDSQRYLFTSIAERIIKRVANDAELYLFSSPEEYLYSPHSFTPSSLDSTVAAIKKRKERIEAMGMGYVFIAIPAKQSIYDDNVDDFTKNYINTLTANLAENEIKTVNLLNVFRENKEKGLFHHYDTHWNSNGTGVAAPFIAEWLIETFASIKKR